MVNPTNAFQQGQSAALKTVGLPAMGQPAGATPAPPAAAAPTQLPAKPGPPKFQSGGVAATAQSAPRAAQKLGGFSISPNPDTRAQEAKRDNVRQPATNEERRVATGIDPAFNYLATPSESDPYTTPRMF